MSRQVMPGPSQNPPPDAPTIPGYELLELLGRGGQGAVYRARQKSLNRVVAIKVLDRQWAEDRAARKRFLAEARLQSKLHHPNILQGIDINSHEGVWYFVMEFVSGTNAHQLLGQRGRPMPEHEALEIARQIADALGHAFERSIVHGDIKPENIVLGADGAVKMIDFGIARLAREERRKGAAMGTAEFMAPEVAKGTSVGDVRSDFFSLGVTLYEMLTASLPPLAKCTPESGPDPRDREPGLSRQTGRLVSRLLATDPERRPANPKVLLSLIEAAMSGQPAQPVVAPAAKPVPSAQRSPVVMRAALGLGLVAVALILFIVSGMGDTEPATPSDTETTADGMNGDGDDADRRKPNGGDAVVPAGTGARQEVGTEPPPSPAGDDPAKATDDGQGTKPNPGAKPDAPDPPPPGPPRLAFMPESLDVYEGDPIRFHVTALDLPAAFEPALKILDQQGRDISASVPMPTVTRDAEDPTRIVITWTAPYAPRHTYRKVAVLVSQPPLQKRFWIGIDDKNRPPAARADVSGVLSVREGDDAKIVDLLGDDPDQDVVEFELVDAGKGLVAAVDDGKLIVKAPDLPGDQGGGTIDVEIRAVDDLDGEMTFKVPVKIEDVDHAPQVSWDVGKSPFVVVAPKSDGGTTVLRGAARGGLNALLEIRDPDRPDLVYKLEVPSNERVKGLSVKPAADGKTRLTWRSTSREPWGPRTFTLVASAQGDQPRVLPFRLQVLRRIEPGASTSTDPIDRAFDWLSRHQMDDGSFAMTSRDFARFTDDEKAWGGGREEHRVGVAALAAIAALRSGDGSPWISKALRFVLSKQNDDGRISNGGQGWMYTHAIATESLALAWHLLGDLEYRKAAVKAVRYLQEARRPGAVGGWRYEVRDSDSDTSVTVWAVRALLCARMAGLTVDEQALRGGLAFTESMMGDDGRIGYREAGSRTVRSSAKLGTYLPKLSESMTAAGLSILASAPTINAADPRIKAAIRLVLTCPPAWSFSSRSGATLKEKLTYDEKRKRSEFSTLDFYYWQHATAMLRAWRVLRGKSYKSTDWKSFATFAKSQQVKSGDARGSWDPEGPWCSDGGRSYATAMIALAIVNVAFDEPFVGEE